jgi:hypothetical protein
MAGQRDTGLVSAHPVDPEPPGYDPVASAAVVTRALQMPGGADLVVGSLVLVPHALVSRGRSGLFRSEPTRVQLAEWRYCAEPSGRLRESHVMDGVVLSEETLSPAEAGWHVARALRQHLHEYGAGILHDVLAVLAGLDIACG